MEWFEIILVCLSSFACGMSVTNLIFAWVQYREDCKKVERLQWEKELISELIKDLKEPEE